MPSSTALTSVFFLIANIFSGGGWLDFVLPPSSDYSASSLRLPNSMGWSLSSSSALKKSLSTLSRVQVIFYFSRSKTEKHDTSFRCFCFLLGTVLVCWKQRALSFMMREEFLK